MVNNQLKIIKKRSLAMRKTHLKKKRVSTGLCRVARITSHGSTKFCRVFAHPDLLPYPDRSSHWIN